MSNEIFRHWRWKDAATAKPKKSGARIVRAPLFFTLSLV
jgi:hypothetical protein